MNQVIKEGSRVRVTVFANGYHRRNFNGEVKGWSTSGLVKVLEDGKKHIRNYSSEHVRLIK